MAARVSLLPLAARLRRRLGQASVIEAATRQVELAPAYVSDRPAAIALPDEFERARAFFMAREFELSRIAGGARTEGPTIAYLLTDAIVGGGAVYCGRSVDVFRGDSAKFLLRGQADDLAEGQLATTRCAEIYFGDWLIDGLSLELLAAERAMPAVQFARPNWLHEDGYRALAQLHAAPARYLRVRKLWVVDDRGLNVGRAARLGALRRRIRGAVAPNGGARRVYLARGRLGSARSLSNHGAVEDLLARLGCAIVEPEHMPPDAIARTLRDAAMVISVEGSVQHHATLSLPEGAVLINIQPPDRFTAPGKDTADMAGLHYAYLVGDPHPDGFSVDLDRLQATIELAEGAL